MTGSDTPARNPPPLNPAAMNVPPTRATVYPPPWRENTGALTWKAVGNALGLTRFGVNIVTLDPGARSSQRHWHRAQDEFVYVIGGEMTLVSEAGETPVRAGHCLGFRAGVPDGHCLINTGTAPATYLVVGDRTRPEHVTYPDIDLELDGNPATGPRWLHKDGTPYAEEHQPKWGPPKR